MKKQPTKNPKAEGKNKAAPKAAVAAAQIVTKNNWGILFLHLFLTLTKKRFHKFWLQRIQMERRLEFTARFTLQRLNEKIKKEEKNFISVRRMVL